MRTQVQKWGNSLALRIPRSLALESQLDQGTEVELSLVKGKLVVTPLAKDSYDLDELLDGVTPKNMHREADTGPARGKEIVLKKLHTLVQL